MTPAAKDRLPGAEAGSHLQRYAAVLPCAEINSSFHRSHRVSTWAKWAADTPADFRFSAKLPKAITHQAKLVVEPSAFRAFVEETAALGPSLGAVLVQLPPSLAFEDCPAAEFLEMIRDQVKVPIALEPRHRSWFAREADDLLRHHQVARVAADPIRDPNGDHEGLPGPGGWEGFRYFRLHGSPRMYYSPYPAEYLQRLAALIARYPADSDTWVIFDNTASGEALGNALDLQALAAELPSRPSAQPKSRRAKQTQQGSPRGSTLAKSITSTPSRSRPRKTNRSRSSSLSSG